MTSGKKLDVTETWDTREDRCESGDTSSFEGFEHPA